MVYTTPESNVYVVSNIVYTSQIIDNGNSGNTGNSGGIQLPFIPG